MSTNRIDSRFVENKITKKTVFDEIQETNSQLADKANQEEILLDKKSLIKNSDFEELPYIQARSSVYTFSAGITSPQYGNKKSLQIQVTNYEGSTDPNKDFSFVLTEKMITGEKLKISFYVYPTVSNKTIFMRMAYMSGKPVNLGIANQWNKVEFELDLSTMTQSNNNLYVDFASSFTAYISDLKVMNVTTLSSTEIPISFAEVSDVLAESPSIINNSDGIIERILRIAQTYEDNISQFVYGNSYTAYDANVQTVNSKYQIDCSSFANLLLHGIPFENSRYNGKTKNKESNLFFLNIDGYKFRLANQLAKYANDKGYAFKVNEDRSNLQPGDILFFSWTFFDGNGDLNQEARENAFMKIDHVGMFLHKKNDTISAMVQFDNGMSSVYYEASNSYMDQCVLAARFPFANVDYAFDNQNLIIDGDSAKGTTASSTAGIYELTAPMEKGKYYTVSLNGSVLTEGGYFLLQDESYNVIYSDYGKSGSYEGIVKFHFLYKLNTPSSRLIVGIGAPAGTPNERSANITWCSLYRGYKRNVVEYIKNPNTLRKWVKPTFVNSWTENASHPVSYRKDGMGKVYLRGVVGGGASGSTAFQLPSGFRPTQFMTFSSTNAGGTANCRVTVDTNGNVTVSGTDVGFAILNTVSFFTD